MNTRFKVFASYNILQYLCDFIHVLIFITVSKCQKSPKLTNIVIFHKIVTFATVAFIQHWRRCLIDNITQSADLLRGSRRFTKHKLCMMAMKKKSRIVAIFTKKIACFVMILATLFVVVFDAQDRLWGKTGTQSAIDCETESDQVLLPRRLTVHPL